jgi:hypothetical protein
MLYVKTVVLTAPMFAVLYHFATMNGPNPMPWWPDSFIMGGMMGLLAAFAVMRFSFAHRAGVHLRNACAMLFRRRT